MKKEWIGKLRFGGRLLLGIYLACLIYFLKYRHILGTAAVVINVAGNVAVFIPFGFALPLLFERIKSFLQVLILSFSMSLLAETMQLVLKVGCFDVDDLLLNTIGGCIGYAVYRIFLRCFRKRG